VVFFVVPVLHLTKVVLGALQMTNNKNEKANGHVRLEIAPIPFIK
jgi:hypothetical protein